MEFRNRFGPWAVVAGASTGTGLALSREVAARGLNVVMVARDRARLEERAGEVRKQEGVEVRALAADLSDPDIGAIVSGATADLEVGLLVYNATLEVFGGFLDSPVDHHVRSIAVNCAGPVVLGHLLAPGMVERGRGGIAIMGSNVATQGSVNFSTYAAGKAFEWILAESLWTELGDHGVDVCTLLAGPIASPSFLRYQETLDRELCSRPDSPDLLDRYRARLLDPSEPHTVAVALLDGLGKGPVCYAHRLDEDVSRSCFALPRAETIALKRAYHETQKLSRARILSAEESL